MSFFDFFKRRKTDYQLAFTSPAGQRVQADLARFCRASESCVVPGNHDASLILEGRREVWLRIQNHLHLSPSELVRLFAAPTDEASPEENPNHIITYE